MSEIKTDAEWREWLQSIPLMMRPIVEPVVLELLELRSRIDVLEDDE